MQLVHGVINSEDELVQTSVETLELGRGLRGRPAPVRRHASSSTSSGAFGYTVRVVPKNDLLASPAELGVVALPA